MIAWLTSFVANGAQVTFLHIPNWGHLIIVGVSCGILGILNRGKVTPA